MPKKKKGLSGAAKALIALAIVVVVVIIILGYLGLISVPFISPSAASYATATEIPSWQIQQYMSSYSPDESDIFSQLQGAGLTTHLYGTDDSVSSVVLYYDLQMAGWELMHSESGSDWTTKVWRNNLYGFALMVGTHPQMKAQTGYNTMFLTVEGPLTAWMQIMDQFD